MPNEFLSCAFEIIEQITLLLSYLWLLLSEKSMLNNQNATGDSPAENAPAPHKTNALLFGLNSIFHSVIASCILVEQKKMKCAPHECSVHLSMHYAIYSIFIQKNAFFIHFIWFPITFCNMHFKKNCNNHTLIYYRFYSKQIKKKFILQLNTDSYVNEINL